MKFYIAPDWMDFENPLICYTAIRAQEWDVGEAFFDYYDCETKEFLIPVLDALVKDGVITEEDKTEWLKDISYLGINSVISEIEMKYSKDTDPETASKLYELIAFKVYQVFADYASQEFERFHKVYELCYNYYGEDYNLCWDEELANQFRSEYYHARNKNLREEIG